MWMTRVSINQPVFATMVMVALMVLGVVSYNRLPIEQMPDITPPMTMVLVSYPGASPEVVEQDVIRPLEEAINSVSGIKRLLSAAREGSAAVWVEFNFDVDPVEATQDIRDRVADAAGLLPREADPPRVTRSMADENAQPILQLAVASESRGLRALSTVTDQLIIKRLQMVTGVGSVRVDGAVPREIQIQLDPEKMRSYGIGVDEIVTAIQRANRDLPAGSVRADDAEKVVRVEGRLTDAAEFGRIIVTTRGAAMYLQQGGLPVHLEQVATIVDGQAEQNSLVRVDGKPALSLQVFKIQGANVVATSDGVMKSVERLQAELPEDIRIIKIRDNADFVRASLDGMRLTIIEGAALTVMIVFMFLRSWRSTIITGLTLPISVVATFVAILALDFTLNMVTLMALSLCIGLLIDDAIVVRENIVRHLDMGKSHRDAARDGTEEIGLAVTATTFAIVAVFVPIAFMDGIIGKYFFQFGITVAVAVLVSLFVSFTLDPMLSAVWRDPVEGRFAWMPWLGRLLDRFNDGVDGLHGYYERALSWSLQRTRLRVWIPVCGLVAAARERDWRLIGTVSHRGVVMWGAALTFASSFVVLPFLGSEFMPEEDQGFVTLRLEMPLGSSLEATARKTQQVREALTRFDAVDSVVANIGTYEGRNHAELTIRLVDARTHVRPSQKELERTFRERVKRIAGVEVRAGWQQAIGVNLIGPDRAVLIDLSEKLMRRIEAIPGAVDVTSTERGTRPSISVTLDRELANDLGLDVSRVGSALRVLVAGDKVTDWVGPDGESYDVVVQLPRDARRESTDLGGLYLSTSRLDADGLPVLVPLQQIARLEESTAPDNIRRMSMQRRVAITLRAEGRSSGEVGGDVQKLIADYELPRGYRFEIAGSQEEMQQAFTAALAAMAVAVIFIYLVLASQFASFVQPVAIMVSLPLSFVGAFLALLITRTTLNMVSMIGLIMLMGLVTKNAILLVDFTNQSLREGHGLNQALLRAGQIRLRPILMTTLAMIFGMLPMAIGLNPSSEINAPMARAVIGGVITSTLLTLLVVPVLYTYLHSFSARAKRRFGHGESEVRRVADATH